MAPGFPSEPRPGGATQGRDERWSERRRLATPANADASEDGSGTALSGKARPLASPPEIVVKPVPVGGPLARLADPSPMDLPLRLRRVLAALLEGDSDKQIAVRLGLSPHTLNQYIKMIYRHFVVRSRPELMARWIRRGWGVRNIKGRPS